MINNLSIKSTFLFVSIIAWFCCVEVEAQTYDSTFYPVDSMAILYFHNKLDTDCPIKLTPIDTTLHDFEAYSPVDKKYLFNASLGNVGLAYKCLNFKTQNVMGFDYGINTFNAYFFDEKDVKYYINPRPYTELGYVTGAEKEQLFDVRHYQRMFKRMAIGVDFNLINSLGTYMRQKSDDSRVAINTQFFTDDLRYGVIANYTRAKIKVRENGGIIHDSIYEQDIETNRSIIGVRLTDAENTLRKSGVYLQQYFQLSRKKKAQINDSLVAEEKKIQIKFGRISHSFNYKRYSQLYSDQKPDVNYYPNIYVDSTETYDSVYFQKIENTFSWSTADYLDRLKPQPFLLLFGIKHQIAEVRDSVKRTDYQNLIPFGEIRISPHPFIKVHAKASYVLTGADYQGEYNLYALGTIEILRKKPYKTSFNFVLDLANTTAPYFYRHYFSNHFIWDNDFSKTKTNKLSAFIDQKNTRLGFDITTLSNYLYIGSDTLAAQSDKPIEVLKAYLHQKFMLGNFDVDSRFIYQKVSEKDIIRLPELMAYFTVTFNLRMFKGALHTRSGFDIYYFSKYYADGYMPAIRSFYIQNEKEIGGYVHADFFLNFNVARTRFFMKFQNILAPFGENNYYQVPHYPLQDFAFKFGLSWRFHD